MTASEHRRLLKTYHANFLVLPKHLRTVAIEEILRIGYLINSAEHLKSYSDLMNARPNSRLSPNDGLLRGHSPGWKTSEDSLSTMRIMPTQWFNLLSVKSCLTNLLDNF